MTELFSAALILRICGQFVIFAIAVLLQFEPKCRAFHLFLLAMLPYLGISIVAQLLLNFGLGEAAALFIAVLGTPGILVWMLGAVLTVRRVYRENGERLHANS